MAARKPRCVDCVAAGITTRRPVVDRDGKPYGGPRSPLCASHKRARRTARRDAARAAHVERVYGITDDEYRAIYAAQGGVCFICRRAKGTGRKRLAVDHRHSDGQVRGLLCSNCNFNVIGKLREDVDALDRAIDYLLDPPAVKVLSGEAETWKPVDGFPGYEVSDLGKVRSWHPYPWNARAESVPRVLQLLDNGNGYKQVTLVRDNRKFKRHVHRLVAEAFHGAPPFEDAEVCHGDGDKDNNRASNLRWDTHAGNQVDLVRSGKHNTTALTEDDVREIRRRLSEGAKQALLAAEYGVNQTTISAIKRRETWQWVA